MRSGGRKRVAMTKAELIEALSNKLPLPKADAERAINIVLDDIIAALCKEERVNISGFGTFSASTRQARTGRNPKTGESIQIAASRSARFKPGKQLKDSLNESIGSSASAAR
jgi:nucleoid DNA-binding protein